ncbi:lysosomal amino acid transporter 1 homolog [Conger conger]|uniref:lysosomal amino acid transporter 1 homolog n=1 Tax=Conger conger TaxID=82655 RepID=UPI002A5A901B|nr:lysosomal amino acid transporter 1 homolog [Conger conger]XP_061114155.1 lysosomal amino acid transporter 1 homolog [Conger conger]XP_061114156.1 lysosomal amino acid transporter 1 homolog [Conger conger]
MGSRGVFSRGSLGWSGFGNISCPNGSQWVMDGLRECAQDARDMASVIMGLVSILCFMVSSMPQYYSSCRSGNMDRALSIWFLLLWLGGDSCNFVGSFLADQLPLQIYTAIYYVLADLLMLGMYSYYVVKNRRFNSSTVVNAVGLVYLAGAATSLAALPKAGPQVDVMDQKFNGRALLSVLEDDGSPENFTTKEIIGFTIGSVSSLLYLCSRLPQIYTNYVRKSTEGLSYFLFALVILGNSLYGLSVLLKNPEYGQPEGNYVLHHLPWLIGSLGTLTLDLVISMQFLRYRKPSQEYGILDEATALLGA